MPIVDGEVRQDHATHFRRAERVHDILRRKTRAARECACPVPQNNESVLSEYAATRDEVAQIPAMTRAPH